MIALLITTKRKDICDTVKSRGSGYTASARGADTGGGGGSGMFGGGAGGGRPITGIDRRGTTPRCACCLSAGIDGLGRTSGTLDARLPGTNDGVLEIARTGAATGAGREDERNGAWSDRTWTLAGRRSC